MLRSTPSLREFRIHKRRSVRLLVLRERFKNIADLVALAKKVEGVSNTILLEKVKKGFLFLSGDLCLYLSQFLDDTIYF